MSFCNCALIGPPFYYLTFLLLKQFLSTFLLWVLQCKFCKNKHILVRYCRVLAPYDVRAVNVGLYLLLIHLCILKLITPCNSKPNATEVESKYLFLNIPYEI